MRGEKLKETTKTEKRLFRRLRYTEDYKSTPYVGANGKSRERLTYIGEWYCPTNADYTRIAWTARAAVLLALISAVGALFVLPPPMNNKWYAAVLTVSLFPLAYAVMGAVRLPVKPDPMERVTYDKSVLRMKHSAAATLIIDALTVLGVIVYWILAATGVYADAAPFALGDGIFLACLAISVAANVLLYAKTAQISIEKRENASFRL